MKKQEFFVLTGLTLATLWIIAWLPKAGSKNFEGSVRPKSDGETCFVVDGSIYDGDTLKVNCAGTLSKVRLCGVDAPEKNQSLGIESRNKLRELLKFSEVEFYPVETDRYGRTVGELFTTGSKETFINAEMVQAGLAFHYEKYSANCPNRAAIVEAERIAKTDNLGVWGAGVEKPWDYRKSNK